MRGVDAIKYVFFFSCFVCVFAVVSLQQTYSTRTDKLLRVEQINENSGPNLRLIEQLDSLEVQNLRHIEELESLENLIEENTSIEENKSIKENSPIQETAQDNELKFIVLGDFGHVSETGTYSGVDDLAHFIYERVKTAEVPYDFMLSAGDVIYYDGIHSETDIKPEILLKNTFRIHELGLDWYSVLGNHDYKGNLKATLELGKRYSQWKPTELYYSKTFNIGNSPLKAGFIYLDGNQLSCLDLNNKECYTGMRKNMNFDKLEDQIIWFENTLKAMSEDENLVWKIVTTHQAVFSKGGAHGDNWVIQQRILPLLVKYNVDLVLSGHDHSVQYLRMDTKAALKEGYNTPVEKPFKVNSKTCLRDEFISITSPTRDSTTNQNEFLHQFVFGNGGQETQRFCPDKHPNSAGKLIYGNTMMGIGDFKITENDIEAKIVSVWDEVMYSVKIERHNSYLLS